MRCQFYGPQKISIFRKLAALAFVLITLAGLSLALSRCSLFKGSGCSLQSSLSTGLTTAMKTALACKNEIAVKDDMDKLTAKLNLCDKNNQRSSIMGKSVCTILMNLALEQTLKLAVPPDWNCHGGMTKEAAGQFLKEQCEKLIP